MKLLDILSGTADSVAATGTFANVACYMNEMYGLVICAECTPVYLIIYVCKRQRDSVHLHVLLNHLTYSASCFLTFEINSVSYVKI
jgi:hypothetical protein